MAKKGLLSNSLFISRKTHSASTDISSFGIKGLKYFEKPLGSCKSLSKTMPIWRKADDREKIALVIQVLPRPEKDVCRLADPH